MRLAKAAALALAFFIVGSAAEAKRIPSQSQVTQFCGDRVCASGGQHYRAPVRGLKRAGKTVARSAYRAGRSVVRGVEGVANATLGPRPRMWCGWWMRQHTGRYDRDLNLARNWLKFPRTVARPGAIVVWARGRRGGGHVGRIVQVTRPCHALVISGNDGGAVRTRERNICNALGIVS